MIQRPIVEPTVPLGAVFDIIASSGGLMPPQMIADAATKVTAIQKLTKKP